MSCFKVLSIRRIRFGCCVTAAIALLSPAAVRADGPAPADPTTNNPPADNPPEDQPTTDDPAADAPTTADASTVDDAEADRRAAERARANVKVCQLNLRGIYTAMFTYANSYDGTFPKHAGTPDGSVVGKGFQPKRGASTYELGTDNPTAALWLLVRDGSLSPSQFICPSTDDQPDPLTLNGLVGGRGAPLHQTWDFLDRRNLSYSTIDMYHRQMRRHWSVNAGPAWIVLSDANNGENPLHRGFADDDRAIRNSRNHHPDGISGQLVARGDASVQWAEDSSVGPSRDNIFSFDAIPDGMPSGPDGVGTGADVRKYKHDLPVDRSIDVYLLPIDALSADP